MSDEVGNQSESEGSTEESNGAVEKPAWLAQLKDDLKDNESLTSFKTISDLGKSYLDLSEKSKGYIKPLGENATSEEVSEYRKSLGLPEKANDYKIEKPEKLPDGMVYDEVLEKKFKEIAFNNNFTPKQFAELTKAYNEYTIAINNAVNKSIAEGKEKAVNTLKTIWKGDSYKENTEKAVRSFRKFLDTADVPNELGGKEGIENYVKQSGFGDDPVMMWFFSKTFDLIGDDKFIKGSPSGVNDGDIYDKMFPSMANKT